ncbi:hypothetical protein LY76DRAFT_275486 [Colletotrichum caudatum]|nr:hypothetical protein LY76DRAFT_275486 [Colletotrichum caudatum]
MSFFVRHWAKSGVVGRGAGRMATWTASMLFDTWPCLQVVRSRLSNAASHLNNPSRTRRDFCYGEQTLPIHAAEERKNRGRLPLGTKPPLVDRLSARQTMFANGACCATLETAPSSRPMVSRYLQFWVYRDMVSCTARAFLPCGRKGSQPGVGRAPRFAKCHRHHFCTVPASLYSAARGISTVHTHTQR